MEALNSLHGEDTESASPLSERMHEPGGEAQGGGSCSIRIFEELDQITPSVTDQLQAFCSLAVHQMKQYPVMMKNLQKNIDALTDSISQIHQRLDEIEEKENKDFQCATNESQEMKLKVESINEELLTIEKWRVNHLEDIKAIQTTTAKQFDRVSSNLEKVDQDLRKTKTETEKRLDSIEDVACTNAKIRDDIHNRLNSLYSKFEHFSEDELKKRHTLQSKLEEHDARMILLEERSNTLNKNLKENKIEITKLDARCEPLENSVNLLRADITAVEREMTRADHHLQELESFKESAQEEMIVHDKRLTDLETDGRIDRLEQLIPKVQDIEDNLCAQAESNKQKFESTDSKILSINQDVDNIHPKVQCLLADASTLKEDVSRLKIQSNETLQELHETEQVSAESVKNIDRIGHNLAHLRDDFQLFQEDKSVEAKRMWDFVEESFRSVPRRHEIESLQNHLEELKLQLLAEIEDSRHAVKFDLLHDPSPQVDRLKDYIQQQEESQSKLKKRLLVLEESLKTQVALMQAKEHQLTDAIEQLPLTAAAKEDMADIPKIKQRLQQLSQSAQSLQEQLLQLKKQPVEENERTSFSRCSSLRSSVILNPATLGFMNKNRGKSLRRHYFIEQEQQQQQTPKLTNSPPKTTETARQEADRDVMHACLESHPDNTGEEAEVQAPQQQQPDLVTNDSATKLHSILEKLVEWLQRQFGGVEHFISDVVPKEDIDFIMHSLSPKSMWVHTVAAFILLCAKIQEAQTRQKEANPSSIANNRTLSVDVTSQTDQKQEICTVTKTKTRYNFPCSSDKKDDGNTATERKSLTQNSPAPLRKTTTNDRQKSDTVAPLIVMPPANFHTHRRHLAGEQQKVLASMQQKESAYDP